MVLPYKSKYIHHDETVLRRRHSFVCFLPCGHHLSLHVLLLCLAILASLSAKAQSRFSISGGPSLASARFDWSIAGDINGLNPNILSELRYIDVQQWGAGLEFGYIISDKFNLQVRASSLRTYSGSGTDMDYQGNDRANANYLLNFASKDGSRHSLDLVFMTPLKSIGRWDITIGLAAGLTAQTWSLTSAETPRLNSPYRTTISGIGPALNLRWAPAAGWLLDAWGTARAVDYSAEATWNLIPAFEQPRSFTHHAAGTSWAAAIKVQKEISPQGKLFLRAESLWDNIQQGVDRAYLRDGSRPETRLNGARGSSLLASLGYTFHF